MKGPLTLVVGGKPKEFWASLCDWKLALWSDREQQEDGVGSAYIVIPINRYHFVQAVHSIIVRTRNLSFPSDTRIEDKSDAGSLTITNASGKRPMSFEFRFDKNNSENLHSWLVRLIQHAGDHRRWKEAATTRMEVASTKEEENNGDEPLMPPSHKRTLRRTRSKLVELYNETGN